MASSGKGLIPMVVKSVPMVVKSEGERKRRQPQAGERRLGVGHPDDNMKVPTHEGEPPRPATEPEGSEDSARNPHTDSNPATGEPNRRLRRI